MAVRERAQVLLQQALDVHEAGAEFARGDGVRDRRVPDDGVVVDARATKAAAASRGGTVKSYEVESMRDMC